jgi:uncharacterized protein YuzE
MFVTFDGQADAAYIALGDGPVPPGSVETTVHSIQAPTGSEINLDFGADGRLIGIEVLNATEVLPKAMLAEAAEPPIYPTG